VTPNSHIYTKHSTNFVRDAECFERTEVCDTFRPVGVLVVTCRLPVSSDKLPDALRDHTSIVRPWSVIDRDELDRLLASNDEGIEIDPRREVSAMRFLGAIGRGHGVPVRRVR
jgi:hypothetical protein